MKKKKKRSSLGTRADSPKPLPFRKTFGYRFLIITIVFVLLGVGAFSWIISTHHHQSVFLWIMVGLFLTGYVLTIILVEAMVLERQGNLNKAYLKQKWHDFRQGFTHFFKD